MSTPSTPTAPKVIEKKLFIAVDPVNNNNKFWQYERLDGVVTEPGKNGKPETGDIRFTWGRVGTEGESKVEMFNEKKLASKIREKTNKKDGPSYNEIQVVGGSKGSAAPTALAKEEVKRVAVKEIAGSCSITATLVKKLAEVNRHELQVMTGGEMDIDLETGIVRTALGVVTMDAVKSARTILDKMAVHVKASNTDNGTYADLLGQYLRLVPQRVPGKRGWHVDFINLTTQTALLDQLETSIEMAEKRVIDAANKGEIKTPTTFNVTMKIVEDKTVIKNITDMFYDTRTRNHSSSSLKPVRVYEIHIPHMAAAFEADGKKVGNVKTLWHGTRMFNVLSIMKRGFVLPNQLSTVQTTGAMYGPGLYFSANSTKSLNYSHGYWDGGARDNNCYMFLVDVAMGREHIPFGSGNGKKPGYDSCWAKPGRSGVINDEQIVYRTSQANIRYLVEFN
jgi:poly [ADP-ribose] polymerase